MKKRITSSLLLIFISLSLLLLSGCNEYGVINAVYTDNLLHKDICRVGNTYFKTLQDAIDYIVSGGQSKALSISQDDTIYLIVDVTEEYPLSKRSGFSVPSSYTEDICMDFGDHSYFFSNDKDVNHFFSVNGGQNIIIQNGVSVILEDSAPDPMALFINSDVVTVKNHTIDDRRVKPKAIEVGEKGKVVVEGDSDKTKLTGEVVVQKNTTTTEPTLTISGGTLEVTKAEISGTVKIEGSDTKTTIDELILETGSDVSVTDGKLVVNDADKKSGSGFDISGGTVEAPHELDTLITEAIGTDTDNVTFEHYHQWGVNGTETFTKTGEEKIPDATCTEDGVLRSYYTCDTCLQSGYADSVIPAKGHVAAENWSTSTTKHWKLCSRCENELLELGEHVPVTMEEGGKTITYCSVCRYEMGTSYSGGSGLQIEKIEDPIVEANLTKNKNEDSSWTLTITKVSDETAPDTFVWMVNNSVVSGATSDTYTFTPSDWNTYEVVCIYSKGNAKGSKRMIIKSWE